MLLTTLDESLLEKILAYRGVIKVGDLVIRAVHGFSYHIILWLASKYKSIIRMKLSSMVLIHKVTYKNILLNTMKDEAYVENLDEYKSVETHWIDLYVNGNSVTYFDSFGIEHIVEGVKRFIRNNKIITIVFRIQAYDATVCGYFCTEFIDFKDMFHKLILPQILEKNHKWFLIIFAKEYKQFSLVR